MKVTVSEGKYTFGQRKGGSRYALCHGEPWREGIFDGMTLAMAHRIEELEAIIRQLTEHNKSQAKPDDLGTGLPGSVNDTAP